MKTKARNFWDFLIEFTFLVGLITVWVLFLAWIVVVCLK